MRFLRAAIEAENLFSISLCRYNIGMVLFLKGIWNEAGAYFMSCLEGLEHAEFVNVEAIAKGALGVTEAFIGDPIHGRALAEEELKAFQDAGIKGEISTLQCYAGMCCHASGDFEEALMFMKKS